MPKVSVIIPVYNAEAYIERCIDSVLKQTCTDFQVILVNDGSKDASEAVIKQLIQQDARFRLINKENAGVSAARNTGLEHADGEWITFLDSDDWLAENYLQNLLQAAAADTETDLVVSGFRRVSGDGKVLYTQQLRDGLLEAKDANGLFNEHQLQDFGYSCSKLCRNALLKTNQVKFRSDISLYEDTLFTLSYLPYCRKVRFTSDVDYLYLDNQQSITARKRDFMFSYRPFRALVDHTHQHFGAGIAALDHRWAIYMNDAIISNYLAGYTRKQRLDHLKRFTSADWGLYRKRFKPFNIFFTLFKYLLLSRQFGLADLVMTPYFKRKRND